MFGTGIQLTKLDVTKNIKLKFLYCNNNQLTELDISENINLMNLYLYWKLKKN